MEKKQVRKIKRRPGYPDSTSKKTPASKLAAKKRRERARRAAETRWRKVFPVVGPE